MRAAWSMQGAGLAGEKFLPVDPEIAGWVSLAGEGLCASVFFCGSCHESALDSENTPASGRAVSRGEAGGTNRERNEKECQVCPFFRVPCCLTRQA